MNDITAIIQYIKYISIFKFYQNILKQIPTL